MTPSPQKRETLSWDGFQAITGQSLVWQTSGVILSFSLYIRHGPGAFTNIRTFAHLQVCCPLLPVIACQSLHLIWQLDSLQEFIVPGTWSRRRLLIYITAGTGSCVPDGIQQWMGLSPMCYAPHSDVTYTGAFCVTQSTTIFPTWTAFLIWLFPFFPWLFPGLFLWGGREKSKQQIRNS